MNVDDSQDNNSGNLKESVMSSNNETDIIQITESMITMPNTIKLKDLKLNTTLDSGNVSFNMEEVDQTATLELSATSPIVNESKECKSMTESPSADEDMNMPSCRGNQLLQLNSATTITEQIPSGEGSSKADNEASNAASCSAESTSKTIKDSQLNALLDKGIQPVNSVENDKESTSKEAENKMHSDSSSSEEEDRSTSDVFLKSLQSFFRDEMNMPSTSNSESTSEAATSSQTNKRCLANFFCVSYDEAEKRQRMNDTEADDNQTDNESEMGESAEIPSSDSTDDSSTDSEYNAHTISDADTTSTINSNFSTGTLNFDEFLENEFVVEDEDDDEVVIDCVVYDSSAESEADEDSYTPVFQKKPPNLSWSVTRELNSRQLGLNPQFSDKYYRSLYTVEHLKLWTKLNGHTGCVNTVEFNDKGNLVASASDDLNVVLWDWAAKKKLHTFKSGHKKNVFQAKWLPRNDDKLLVTSSRDGQVRLIHVPTGTNQQLTKHKSTCNKLATHVDTPFVLLSAGVDGRVLLIDIRDEDPTKLVTVKNKKRVKLYSINSNPLDSNTFCVSGEMNEVHIYDKRKCLNPLQRLYPEHLLYNCNINITSAVYNYNGTEILASYNDESIYLFDTSPLEPLGNYAHCYKGHRNSLTVKGVSFYGPKSEYVVSGSDCRNIFMWEKESEAIVQWMEGDMKGPINSLATHPEFPVMVSSGFDCTVKVWLPSPSRIKVPKRKLEECIKSNSIIKEEGSEVWSLFRCIHWRFSAALLNSNPDNE